MASKFPYNPVAQVRVAARKTGEEFASSLSLSVGAIRNMERGVLSPGEETKEKIYITYGADIDSLNGKKGTALYARGGIYTWDTYLEWQKLTTVDDLKAKKLIDIEVQRVRWFLQAAAMHGSLFSNIFQLESALEKMTKQGGLGGLVQTVIRQEGRTDPWFKLDIGTVGVVQHVMDQLGLEPSSSSTIHAKS